MEWLLCLLHSEDEKTAAKQIAMDAIGGLGADAERHLDDLRRERPNLLWLRALLSRAIKYVRRDVAEMASRETRLPFARPH